MPALMCDWLYVGLLNMSQSVFCRPLHRKQISEPEHSPLQHNLFGLARKGHQWFPLKFLWIHFSFFQKWKRLATIAVNAKHIFASMLKLSKLILLAIWIPSFRALNNDWHRMETIIVKLVLPISEHCTQKAKIFTHLSVHEVYEKVSME